ncbi:shikimate dehydrogenase [Spirochaetia bacterium 38H-sp]|uniref:Shikimate dehydrogenase (NADP(+)) n=1 Tax=Rarispira pelagica TaxID=3141764 RepID=A0ABU9UAN4_9SPIR
MAVNVVLSLTSGSVGEALSLIDRYASYCQGIELRADCLASLSCEDISAVSARAKELGLFSILTLRHERDGGFFHASYKEHDRVLSELVSCCSFDFVDVEEWASDSIVSLARSNGSRVIRSAHFFSSMPSDIVSYVEALAAMGDVPKLACMLSSSADFSFFTDSAMQLKSSLSGDYILVGMGEYGFPSRVLASIMGSFITFSSVGTVSAAPGHVSPDVLYSLYRVPSINEGTSIFGIIGNPVLHSMSPGIHNPIFAEKGLDAVYIPFCVDSLEEFFSVADRLNIKGVSVTIPHKQAVIPFLDSCADVVSAVGACNTVVRRGSSWWGTNTDVYGFWSPLEDVLSVSTLASGRRATVIGAGGAARSVVYALVKNGFDVLILNRTVEKAASLAADFSCEYAALDESSCALISSYRSVIVQTTSLGMGNNCVNPLAFYDLQGDEICYDIVYIPKMTPFLSFAEKKGCRIITGDLMLKAQAIEQSRLFCELV